MRIMRPRISTVGKPAVVTPARVSKKSRVTWPATGTVPRASVRYLGTRPEKRRARVGSVLAPGTTLSRECLLKRPAPAQGCGPFQQKRMPMSLSFGRGIAASRKLESGARRKSTEGAAMAKYGKKAGEKVEKAM